MKKITKLFGLLLVAGAMLVGCKMEPNIETNEIVLANGNWEMEETGFYSETSSSGTETTNMTIKATISVSGDEVTYLSMSESGTISYTLSESATAAEVQAKKASAESLASKNGGTVTVDGKTITITIPMISATDDEIAKMNKDKTTISELNQTCNENGGVIKRNRKKTEYTITYTITSSNPNSTSNYTIHLKKQK
jgi:hypothetical protein